MNVAYLTPLSQWQGGTLGAALANDVCGLTTARSREPQALHPVTVGGDRCGEIWDKTRATRGLPPAATEFNGWQSDEVAFERAVDRLVEAIREPSATGA